MKFKYSFNGEKENMAKAYGRDMAISTKQSVEVCDTIRGMDLKKAQLLLDKVISKERAIKMKRFNRDTAHKKGIGPGKYPVKTAKAILRLLNSVEANAQNKGLSTKNLVIRHIVANKASRPWHYGRQRRRKMKRTHVEVVVEEKTKEKKTKDKKVKKEKKK